METLSEDVEEHGGRSLRKRQRRVSYCEEYDEDDEEEVQRVVRQAAASKSRGQKRKAEVNIESLYRQENNKDVCPTALETIFESPRPNLAWKKSGRVRKKEVELEVEKGEETVTKTEDGDNALVMSVRKMKRLCLFVNYYQPTKQKVRFRKERARKLKQIKGVKIPKGTISVEDVQALLAGVSDDDDNERSENNQNISNTTLSTINHSVGFYVGNVIRPDTENTELENVIENMKCLGVNSADHQSDMDVVPNQTLLDEGIMAPLPFTDDDHDLASPGTGPKVKKSRRRSGRVTACPRLLFANNNSDVLVHSEHLSVQSDSYTLNDLQEGSCKPVLKNGKRRNTQKSQHILSDDDSQETILTTSLVKGTNEQIKRQKSSNEDENKIKKVKTIESRVKRRGLVVEEDAKKKKEVIEEVGLVAESESTKRGVCKSTSDAKVCVTTEDFSPKQPKKRTVKPSSSAGKHGGHGNKRGTGKRRVSGIQRQLYRTVIASPGLDKSLKDSTGSSPNMLELSILPAADTHLTSSSITPKKVSSSVNVSQKTLPEEVKTSLSPVSPSTQMAALTLHSEQPAGTSVSSVFSPVSNSSTKTEKKTRRRSTRIGVGSLTGNRLEPCMSSTSNLGSFQPQSSTLHYPEKVSHLKVPKSADMKNWSGQAKPTVSLTGYQEASQLPENQKDTSSGGKKRGGRRVSDAFLLRKKSEVIEETKMETQTAEVDTAGMHGEAVNNKRSFEPVHGYDSVVTAASGSNNAPTLHSKSVTKSRYIPRCNDTRNNLENGELVNEEATSIYSKDSPAQQKQQSARKTTKDGNISLKRSRRSESLLKVNHKIDPPTERLNPVNGVACENDILCSDNLVQRYGVKVCGNDSSSDNHGYSTVNPNLGSAHMPVPQQVIQVLVHNQNSLPVGSNYFTKYEVNGHEQMTTNVECSSKEGYAVNKMNSSDPFADIDVNKRKVDDKCPSLVLPSLTAASTLNTVTNTQSTVVGTHTSERNGWMSSLMDNPDWDSPVISGMFEGKAGIRQGKQYRNKDTTSTSPLTLDPFCPKGKKALLQQVLEKALQ